MSTIQILGSAVFVGLWAAAVWAVVWRLVRERGGASMLPEPNRAPGAYYVSCIDGPRWALLLGPFVWHATALAWVPQVRELAYEVDPKSWFFGFGTWDYMRTSGSEAGQAECPAGHRARTIERGDDLRRRARAEV